MTLRTGGFGVGLMIVAMLPGVAFAQSIEKLPEFEAASILPYITDLAQVGPGVVDARMPNLNVNRSRIVDIVNLNMQNLVMLAYGVGGSQITAPWRGDTEWTNLRFSIVAKVPDGADKKDVPLMLQALLAERFHLVLHREQKTTAVYALEIGKGPLKLQEVKADEQDSSSSGCTRSYGSEAGWFVASCQGMTATRLAQAIQSLGPAYFVDKPVVDLTGLTGVYDFSVEWGMKALTESGGNAPTMFDAVEKLGLKFVLTNHAMDFIVVDHCDKQPTEN
jgi:uncharacterized protein (TIGR03435 family)